jgi:hypothetical protein
MRYFNMTELFSSKKRERGVTCGLFKAWLWNLDTNKQIKEDSTNETLYDYIGTGEPGKQIKEWIKNNCGVREDGSICGQFSDMWLDCYSYEKEIVDPLSIKFTFENVNYIIYWSVNTAD